MCRPDANRLDTITARLVWDNLNMAPSATSHKRVSLPSRAAPKDLCQGCFIESLKASLALGHFLSVSAYSKQTCSLMFRPVNVYIDPTQTSVWCKNGGNVLYTCINTTCHVHTRSLYDGLRFEGCWTKYLTQIPYVWPTDFTARWDDKSVGVTAGKIAYDLQSNRSDLNSEDFIHCYWGNSSDHPNLVRPDCDICLPGWQL
ncbi:hypothetical protein O181_029359 [Austropuccinia psidii MF-1]|uniref:Uncharacterized protein n=1 Tax=Austropuccinia psidii MF-1 TaxID=1389203 RepID=A0A9Q3CQR2_9BASI|nr:hypothetical protein [Austropuccinia psidii MF-1]